MRYKNMLKGIGLCIVINAIIIAICYCAMKFNWLSFEKIREKDIAKYIGIMCSYAFIMVFGYVSWHITIKRRNQKEKIKTDIKEIGKRGLKIWLRFSPIGILELAGVTILLSKLDCFIGDVPVVHLIIFGLLLWGINYLPYKLKDTTPN